MGTGWSDVFSPNIWRLFCKRSLVASGYGKLFSPSNIDRRPYATAEYATFAIYAHTAQFILLAGVGHATLNEGVRRKSIRLITQFT